MARLLTPKQMAREVIKTAIKHAKKEKIPKKDWPKFIALCARLLGG